jgi:ATP synthase subunit 6
MRINLINFFGLFYSPLEQFEIHALNSKIHYTVTFPVELFETKFLTATFFTNTFSLFELLICGSLILLLQTNLKQKGFVFLFSFIYIILINLNLFSFTDIIVNNITVEKTGFSANEIAHKYLQTTSNTFEYITVIASFSNFYTVLFCFIFTYIVIYLIYSRMLSNNTNMLIPNLYQFIGQLLFTISFNLFRSILGKSMTNPEFFIKVNSIFIFLIISNMQGMIPYMSTLTSALTNTFFMAFGLFISLMITLIHKKGLNYFLSLFLPAGCPIALSLLIIPIELISYCFRVVSLSVRLFANMMAGHTLLKVIVGFS